MKTNFLPALKLFPLLAAALLTVQPANASTISGGVLTMNLDQAALAASYGGADTNGLRGLYVEEFFDASYNHVAITGTSPDPTPGTGPISPLGLQFAVNGYAPLAPQPGKSLQSSSLAFTTDPTDGTGQIGLSGLIRIRSDLAFTGYVTWQELDLTYSASRINQDFAGASGWLLQTNNPGFGKNDLFDLTNVTTSIVGQTFNMSGNLAIAPAWGSGFFGIPDGTQLGSFSFQTTVVPLPGAFWLFGSGILSVSLACRRKMKALI